MFLRPATASDCDLILDWTNDPDTRSASFHSAPIGADEHRAWFDAALEGARTLYVIESEQATPLGLARLDPIDAHSAEVGLIIAPEHRGCGLASAAIAALIERAATDNVTRLVAKIRAGNERSLRAFVRAGFVADGEETIAGITAMCYMHAS